MESGDVPHLMYRHPLRSSHSFAFAFLLCFFSGLSLFSLHRLLVPQAHEVSLSKRWVLWACLLKVGKAELGRAGKAVPESVSQQTSVQMLLLRSKAALTPCSLIL